MSFICLELRPPASDARFMLSQPPSRKSPINSRLAWLETRAVLRGLRAGIAGIRAEMAGPDFLTESIIIKASKFLKPF